MGNKLEMLEGGDIITPEELRLHFPPLEDDQEFDYSGTCKYCKVKIMFSDAAQVKVKAKGKKDAREFSLYHNGCYERYLRRTID